MELKLPVPTVSRILVTIPHAAELLDLPESSFYELLAKGEIAKVKIGRRTRIPVAALTEYAERLSREVA